MDTTRVSQKKVQWDKSCLYLFSKCYINIAPFVKYCNFLHHLFIWDTHTQFIQLFTLVVDWPGIWHFWKYLLCFIFADTAFLPWVFTQWGRLLQSTFTSWVKHPRPIFVFFFHFFLSFHLIWQLHDHRPNDIIIIHHEKHVFH